MIDSNARLCFIGGGNMASALIGGLLQSQRQTASLDAPDAPSGAISGNTKMAHPFAPHGLSVIETSPTQRNRLLASFGVHAHESVAAGAAAGALQADAIILTVKPDQLRDVALSIAPYCHNDRLVVSVAAGVRATDLAGWLGGHQRIIRAMPNTPALVGAGITGLIALQGVPQTDRQLADAILCAVGSTLWFDDERQLDAVTALSGSGPAYVFHFMEAMLAAAAQLGLTEEQARTLTLATFSGAAALAQQSGEAPAVLRQRVTSPGGTTAAALGVMAEQGVAQGIMAGIVAAQRRSQELGDLIAQPPAPPH